MEIDYLRAEARRCLEESAHVRDEQMARKLVKLAAEFDSLADKLAAEQTRERASEARRMR